MNETRDIFSVSRLNSELRHAVEGSFPLIWVEGEISNLSQPRSGHLYFSLKDEHAQIRCALFRNRRNLLRFQPENGTRVVARVRVTFYEPRGDCQLVVEHLEPAGEGLLQQAFERLKQQLQAEGLFDAARKRELPGFPQCIGVISSPSGAALRDVLQVLRRRYPLARVIIYPSSVQGAGAAAELRQALALAMQRDEADVLILTRGGGSLEDLAAFNDELLARTIAACPIPLISAVGHEIDFTIADFVADRRAPTPSAAAELASPDAATLQRHLVQWQTRLVGAMRVRLRQRQQRLAHCQARLQRQHPGVRLQQQTQRLDELQLRLSRLQARRLLQARQQLRHLRNRLQAAHPAGRIRELAGLHRQLQTRLHAGMRGILQRANERLASRARELHAVSPLATLQRGYSIASDSRGQLLRSVSQVERGDHVSVRLADGTLHTRVESLLPQGED